MHPGREGHWLIAEALIDRVFGRVTSIDTIEERPEILALVQQGQRYLRALWFNMPFMADKFRRGQEV